MSEMNWRTLTFILKPSRTNMLPIKTMPLLAPRTADIRCSTTTLKTTRKSVHKPMADRQLPKVTISRGGPAISDTERNQDGRCLNKWPPTLTFHPIACLPTGGFSKLYLARCRELNKVCALKILNDSALLQNHVREAAHLLDNTRFSSPFLLSLVVGFTTSKKNHCIATEYYACGDLHTVRSGQPNHRLPVDLAKFYCTEITLGIEHLHGRKIIHRDIKPENILVNRDGHVAIADFDMAVRFEDRMKTSGGTPDYMSPERLDEMDYGYPADWWSLGITMHTLVFGYHPRWNYKLDLQSNKDAIKARPIDVRRETFIADLSVTEFIQCLLEYDPVRRLGSSGSILRHHFLGGVDGEEALRKVALNKRLKPPMIPPVHNVQRTRNGTPAVDILPILCYTSSPGVYLGNKNQL